MNIPFEKGKRAAVSIYQSANLWDGLSQSSELQPLIQEKSSLLGVRFQTLAKLRSCTLRETFLDTG